MTTPPLRILIVEDIPSDALLAEREIRKAGLDIVTRRVETKDEYLCAIDEFKPDLILSDYKLPSFDGMTALRLSLERSPDIPFLVFTGSMNEETAVDCMKAGATDYVIKGHIDRLGLAIKGALERSKIKTEKDFAEHTLRASEERYRLLAENAQDIVFRYRLKPDRGYEYVSPASTRILGYTPEEHYADPDFSLKIVHPDDRRMIEEVFNGSRKFEDPLIQRWIRRDGRLIWTEQRSVPILDQRGEIVAIEGITRDITERMESDAQLRQSREILRKLSSYLQAAREDERTTIARRVHDELGQALTALKMDIAWISCRREATAIEEKKKTMTELIDGAILTVQRITTELRPGILDDFGLAAAIEWQAAEFQRRTGIACDLTVEECAFPLEKIRETALFRILQESLTNISRHAEATRISIRMATESGTLVLEVKDNGQGIPVEAIRSPNSFGIIGMQERAQAIGGELRIHSPLQGGTVVTVRIPKRGE
jgi:two-component system sensor histidine kinase UhpB